MASRERLTIQTLRQRKRIGRRVSMLTCYDFATARLMEEAQIDALLVGDTYAEVCLGHSTTLPATVEHMVTLAEAVRRGAPTAFVVGDMPYLSYQVCPEDAIRNAGLFMARAGCDCVKVEVDRRLIPTVEAMARATIPVMAHLGLLPQSIGQMGSYRVRGKQIGEAKRIIEDARLMEEAGVVALLLEAVPIEVAKIVTESTELPVIGCFSGPHCDGQVVVLHDMLGYGGGHPPKALKPYLQLHELLVGAFRAYGADVSENRFPSLDQGVSMNESTWKELQRMLGRRAEARTVEAELPSTSMTRT